MRPTPLLALAALAACTAPDAAAPDAAAPDVPVDAPAVTDRTSPHDLPIGACGALPLPAWATVVGATLAARCARVELHVTALDDGALRLRYAAPGAAPPRSFAVVDAAPARAVAAGATAAGAVLCGDGITALIAADTCRVRVLDATGRTLLDDGDAPGWSRAADGSVRVERATPADERFYGFGERHGPLERRGRAMVFYNTDAYDPAFGGVAPTADPLYASIPFFAAAARGRRSPGP